jgi:DNA replication protein DnaC
MMAQQTIEKLLDLRLKMMAEDYAEQKDRGDMGELSFDDRFGLLVDREWLRRKEHRTQRRLKGSKSKQQACVEDIDYRSRRGLDRKMMEDLATCHWIRAGRNLLMTGPTGVGKTWLSCALINRACRDGLTALYYRVPRLTHELTIARGDGTYLKLLGKLARVDLLVLDDWALAPLEGQDQHDLLEVVDDRAGLRSTLVTSQLPATKWHDVVADPSVADALLDRLIGSAIKIELKGGSLRKSEATE